MKSYLDNIILAIAGLISNEESRFTLIAIVEVMILVALAVYLFVTLHPVKGFVLSLGAVFEIVVIIMYKKSIE